MSNKYLEKIALNALEKHLANQPPDKVYANSKINKAQGLVQKSKEALKTGAFAKQYGGSAEAVKKYSDMARTMLQRHRSLMKLAGSLSVEDEIHADRRRAAGLGAIAGAALGYGVDKSMRSSINDLQLKNSKLNKGLLAAAALNKFVLPAAGSNAGLDLHHYLKNKKSD